MSRENLLAALRDDAHLWQDFDAICSFVGRQAGTPGCDAAFAFVADRLAALGPVRNAPTRYHGWSRDAVRLTTPDGTEVPCLPLVGSASSVGDVLLEVLDLARDTPEQIAAAGDAVRGRAVLPEHEYVFADDTIHRRVKLGAAVAAGAAAVVMVQPIPGIGPVSGGANGCPVPGFGVGTSVRANSSRPARRAFCCAASITSPQRPTSSSNCRGVARAGSCSPRISTGMHRGKVPSTMARASRACSPWRGLPRRCWPARSMG